MATLLKYKVTSKNPKRSLSIIVIGSPYSGKSTLSKSLSQKYGLIYVSTRELIANEVFKKTKIGLQIYDDFKNNQMIQDSIMISLVLQRIQKTDCKMYGFILDGFPKNLVQMNALEDFKINIHCIIYLETTEAIINERQKNSQNILQKQIVNWNNFRKEIEEQGEFELLKIDSSCSPENLLQKASFHIEKSI